MLDGWLTLMDLPQYGTRVDGDVFCPRVAYFCE